MRALARGILRTPALASSRSIGLGLVSIGRQQLLHRHGGFQHYRRALTHPQRHPYHPRSFSDEDSTIFALSTASGKAAIAVIRISGPACIQVSLAPERYSSGKC